MDKIDGDPTAMATTAHRLTAPPLPGSLGRASAPISPPGLVEGFAMSIVDKLASVAAADYLAKVTGDIAAHATNVGHIALEYSWADLASAAELVGASATLAGQGAGVLRTAAAAGAGED